MTEIAKAAHDETQRNKWRAQAAKIAAELKAVPSWGERTRVQAGIVFDDQIVKVGLEVSLIQSIDEATLTEFLFNAVLECQNNSETDHAAPQAPDPAGKAHPDGQSVAEQPAAAAVVEQCMRRLEPDFKEFCQVPAAGAPRLLLLPHVRFQQRYGKQPMLRVLLDLPVCQGCFGKMTPIEVIGNALKPEQWAAISKEAQRRNAGILPIKENSAIEFVPFNDPEYVALRAHIAKADTEKPKPAANDGAQA